MQKGFAALLLLITVLVISGAGVYFYFSQIPSKNIPFKPSDKKENLKTYQNEKLGFQFEYNDQDFKVQEDSEDEFNKRGNGDFRKNFSSYVSYEPGKSLGAVVVLDKSNSLDEVASSAYDTNPFTLWVFDNISSLTIDKWYENFWYYPFVWGDYTQRRYDVAPINEATVSGKLAKYGIVTYQPNSPKFFYLPSNEKMYLIRLIGEDGDKILSTLQFLPDQNMESKGCVIGGCSGQLCVEESEEGIMTTCEYKEEYACYKTAKCERQADEKCGWTRTNELTQCLEEKKRNNSSEIIF